MQETTQPALLRAIGRWDLLALMINSTIGAGILGLPGKLFALTGVWCLAVCLAAGVLMSAVAACFAQTSSRFSRTGGVYVYIRTAFGPWAGFVAGWLAVVSRLLSYAGIANLADTYLAALLPGAGSAFGRAAFITVISLGLSVPVWVGVRLSVATHHAFTLIKLTLLLGFAACTLPALLAHGVPATALPPASHWGPAIVLMVFALAGMESAVVSNGEMKQPARDLPFALLAGMACIVCLYGAVLAGAMATVPGLAHATRPVFDGAMRVLGPSAGLAVVASGIASMAGVMFVILFGGPRMMFAMAEAGQLPAALGWLHPRFRTPIWSVLLHGTAAWALAMSFGFFGALSTATLTRLLYYAAIAAASVRLRQKGFSETPSPLALPGGSVIAALVVVLCVAVVAQSDPGDIESVAIVTLIGAGLASVMGRTRRARSRA